MALPFRDSGSSVKSSKHIAVLSVNSRKPLGNSLDIRVFSNNQVANSNRASF